MQGLCKASRIFSRTHQATWKRCRSTGFARTSLVVPQHLRRNHSVAADVTKVEKLVLDSIKATGPLSFATYMQLCLGHPTHGYYTNPDHPVFGTSGDFITSPEISQVFGELVAIWFVSQWAAAGKPPAVRLVELGPGRGTLMADILRTISKFGLTKALSGVHLVETSEALRKVQEEKLTKSPLFGSPNLQFHNHLSEIPRSPSEYTILVAHEFFDALPIHVLQKSEKGWHEVLIATTEEPPAPVDGSEQVKEEAAKPITSRLRRVLSREPSITSKVLAHSSARFDDLPVGTTIEVSPNSFRTAHEVANLLSVKPSLEGAEADSSADNQPSAGGCGLIIDYGGAHVYGSSFRAFKEHKQVDPFFRPGECDLTANVDFAYLKEAMSDLVDTHGPISQGDFLERMGLSLRVKGLIDAANSEDRKKAIEDAANRLVSQAGMGKEYQFLGITSHRGEGSQEKQAYPFVDV